MITSDIRAKYKRLSSEERHSFNNGYKDVSLSAQSSAPAWWEWPLPACGRHSLMPS
jgi:hypothetical protein